MCRIHVTVDNDVRCKNTHTHKKNRTEQNRKRKTMLCRRYSESKYNVIVMR
jgi:hypothetical protein